MSSDDVQLSCPQSANHLDCSSKPFDFSGPVVKYGLYHNSSVVPSHCLLHKKKKLDRPRSEKKLESCKLTKELSVADRSLLQVWVLMILCHLKAFSSLSPIAWIWKTELCESQTFWSPLFPHFSFYKSTVPFWAPFFLVISCQMHPLGTQHAVSYFSTSSPSSKFKVHFLPPGFRGWYNKCFATA